MRELKADLHLHSAEDPYDVVGLDAYEVIDRGVKLGFEVMAITNHLTRTYSEDLSRYSSNRGVLLIPGAEVEVGKRHVLVLNPTERATAARTFDELREARRLSDRPMAVVAPHPFFPSSSSLGKWVQKNLDMFDALEHTAFYFRGIDYNRIARRMGRRLGLPVIANSDAHYSWQFGRTYSMIEADKTIDSVIEAIVAGRLRIVTLPLPLNRITIRMGLRALRIPEYLLWKEWREGDPF